MEPNFPDRLLKTRDLLMGSLSMHARDCAPAMPAGLAADIEARFEPRMVEAGDPPKSFFNHLRNWLASPGFGLAAAAVVMIGVVVPMLSTPDADIFRGESSLPSGETVRIAFVGENADVEAAVKSSGSFEAFAFAADAGSLPGPKVVIDLRQGTICSVDFAGDTIHSTPLPAKAKDVAAAVADAISRF